MLSIAEGKTAVNYARQIITSTVRHQSQTTVTLGKPFEEKHGVFVTLHTHPEHELRGCIGIPYPELRLKNALEEAARSATHDPRFPPLGADELKHVIIEVTILSNPRPLQASSPEETASKIRIGRDGLIIEQGFNKGLLLPQVPVEEDWDVETYLGYACMKAGLPADAWVMPQTKIFTFTGQIFSEQNPEGTIQEKHLNGPQH